MSLSQLLHRRVLSLIRALCRCYADLGDDCRCSKRNHRQLIGVDKIIVPDENVLLDANAFGANSEVL